MSDFPNGMFGFSFTEYLTIFVGLIFAIAVGEFLISIGSLIRHRRHVKFYWEYVLWLVLILDLLIISWFVEWPRLTYIKESLFNYIVMIIPYLIAFIIVAIYFPEHASSGEVDLKQHFKQNRKLFFILWAAYSAMGGVMDVFMPVGFGGLVSLEFVYAAFMLLAAFYDKIWYRVLLAMIIFGDLVGAMVVLRGPAGQ